MLGQGAAGARELAWAPAQPGAQALIADDAGAAPLEAGVGDRAAVRGAFKAAEGVLGRTGGARPALPGKPPGSSQPDHRRIQPQWRYMVRSQDELTPEVRVQLWRDAQDIKDRIADNVLQQRKELGNKAPDSPRRREHWRQGTELQQQYNEIQRLGPVPAGLYGLTEAELRREAGRLKALLARYREEQSVLLDGKVGLPPPLQLLEQESELSKVIDALTRRRDFVQGILQSPEVLEDRWRLARDLERALGVTELQRLEEFGEGVSTDPRFQEVLQQQQALKEQYQELHLAPLLPQLPSGLTGLTMEQLWSRKQELRAQLDANRAALILELGLELGGGVAQRTPPELRWRRLELDLQRRALEAEVDHLDQRVPYSPELAGLSAQEVQRRAEAVLGKIEELRRGDDLAKLLANLDGEAIPPEQRPQAVER